ncbi:MAG TPA: NAD-dependent epimerase/dehydratase family protein [Actinopolymorphaceae bacterium]|jgi:UDP-2-acetamido-2,6-beta-L-arabino-hexul-4-ose reductase
MRIVVTGSTGFLGWHLRARLRAHGRHEVVGLGRHDLDQLPQHVSEADALVHLAGINRGPDELVEKGNVALARTVADAVCRSRRPIRLVYANSIQAGNSTPYGAGKAEARDLLAAAARETGSTLVDIRLPNLFGEHGRPHYNSFVATFVHALTVGDTPTIIDREVRLLHVQRAAQELIDAVAFATDATVNPQTHVTTVQQVWDQLREMHRIYRTGDIPPLRSRFDLELFNTLRAAMFSHSQPIRLTTHHDHRGALTECVRAHGGQGQSFVSTSIPKVTRGDHFHLSKVERFVVVKGRARIALRRLFTGRVVTFDVTGDEPVAVDMPTLWAHNITNVGDNELVTLFWTDQLFDPKNPDTFPEQVTP